MGKVASSRRPLVKRRSVKRKAVPSTAAKEKPARSPFHGRATPSPSKEPGDLRGTPSSPAKDQSAARPKSPAKAKSPPDAIQGRLLGDGIVALALADILGVPETTVRACMRRWEKPILK